MTKVPTKINDIFAVRVELKRLMKRMSRETLAQRSGLSVQRIEAIERGRENVDLDTVEKLADALKVLPFSLLATPSPKNIEYLRVLRRDHPHLA